MGNKPLQGLEYGIDVEKFSGEWYVIAALPTVLEKSAFNPKESYTWLPEAETVDVRFSFNRGGLNGKKTTFRQLLIPNEKNGNWKMKPVPAIPFKLNYVILEIGGTQEYKIDNETKSLYSHVVIGHPSRSYFWIMGRDVEMDAETMEKCKQILKSNDFDTTKTFHFEHAAKV